MNLKEHTDQYLADMMLESWVTANKESRRTYLGMSQLGHSCKKYLWLNFRHAFKANFPGRILRLFNRGHREEAVFIEELERLGVKVVGDQYEVACAGGHCKGHTDGVAVNLPNQTKPNLLEFKTMSDKYFKEMQKKGVKEAKPIYYAQMQIYMYLCELERAFFIVVNKNTDDLYSERVKLNKTFAKGLVKKAEDIIFSENCPPGISDNPSYFECKFCDAHDVCHGLAEENKTCRMCMNSKPIDGGEWECTLNDRQFGTLCECYSKIAVCDNDCPF